MPHSESPAAPPSLVYVADPMCSWCYGFGPELIAVRERFPDWPLHLVMGGLRAYNTEVMDQQLKDMLRHHWHEVAARSGQPFSEALLERNDFVYDTEPPCRAVVTVRELRPDLAWPMLRAVQAAFYAQGHDVTQAEVLADLAQSVGMEREAFETAFDSPDIQNATRDDFAVVQRWSVRGFPTLIAVKDGQGQVVAPGYLPAAAVIARLASIVSA